MTLDPSADAVNSTYRERLIEHMFVGALLRELWLSGVPQVEVLRSEVDASGYDLVLECRSVVRHVQLKAARLGGSRANVGVNVKLAAKPGGCIVWIYFDPVTLELREFFWFGGSPGQPLPLPPDLRVGKHSKGDSTGSKNERPNIRVLPKGKFERIDNMAALARKLFGGSAWVDECTIRACAKN